MPKTDTKTLVPKETIRVIERNADYMQRLNPHEPVAEQISHKLTAEAERRQPKTFRRSRGAWIYLVVLLGAQGAIVSWVDSKY